MRSVAKKIGIVLVLVASSACKHPEAAEAEGASEEAVKEAKDGDEKEPQKPPAKDRAKKRAKAHAAEEKPPDSDEPAQEGEGEKHKGRAAPKEGASKEGDVKLASHTRVEHASEGHKEYDVPFIEGHRDPLALTRGFLRDALADNARYMQKHDASFFKDFAFAQTPRATVVTCSDSRVQSAAFDATAENDDFFIRNIGNQIVNSEGSVEYGVHHLHTPVLLILGHTGCGAVKAAMGDYSKESEAISHELASLHLPPRKDGVKDDDPKAWLDAVVDNVNDQVTLSLGKFDDELSRGVLTIVGAVYDFRNDLKQGPGKVAIVNVNGVTDQAKLKLFVRSIGGTVPDEEPVPVHPTGKDAPALTSLSELRAALAHLPVRSAASDAAHAREAKESEADKASAKEAVKAPAKEGGKEAPKGEAKEE